MKFLVVILASFISFQAEAKKPVYFGNTMVDEITSIYDADTFRANIAGWPAIIGERVPIRINGIDAPEIRGKCKLEKQLARQAKQVTVELLRSAKKIELRNIQRGKYFRIISDVFADDVSVAQVLIDKNLAYEYYGGKRKTWCKQLY